MLRFAPIALSCLMCAANAQVQLSIDPHIKVVAINGEQVSQGAFSPLRREFELPAGATTIKARYDRLYELRGGEHDYLRSQDIAIETTLQEGGRYVLALVDSPEPYHAAKRYAQNPTLAVTAEGRTIATGNKSENKSSLVGSLGALFGYNDDKKSTATKASTLEQFVQLWQQADDSERQKIRQWLQ